MRFEDILIPRVEDVTLVERSGPAAGANSLNGTLHITTTHLIFRAEPPARYEIWIAIGQVGNIERGALSASGTPILVRCRHFRWLSLIVRAPRDAQLLCDTLTRAARPASITELCAFERRAESSTSSSNSSETSSSNGASTSTKFWLLDWAQEFYRQGLQDNSLWKMIDANVNYELSPTYPRELWLPSPCSKEIAIGSANFRSRGRLPVLSYFYAPTRATLVRCAQPLAGLSARRSPEDERLVELIGRANPTRPNFVYLVDTRPKVNAMVNRVQGKGYEDERNYPTLRVRLFDIDNIHVMRSSQNKLVEACQRATNATDYWRAVEASGWLHHLRAILTCSQFLAEQIARGISCIVHCSDGWDRTSQTVAAAQILLDPYYRTIEGFQVLIEKDWLGFGHKFDDRCGHVLGANSHAVGTQNQNATVGPMDDEVSPIFSQFLDLTWQLMKQRPRAFEFNENFLVELHEHTYSSQFGTLLGNSDKERKELHIARRTQSLWQHFDQRRSDYLNPFYEPSPESPLDVDSRAQAFQIWQGLYNRFEPGLHPKENLFESVSSARLHCAHLETHIRELEQELASLSSSSSGQVAAEPDAEEEDNDLGPLGPAKAPKASVQQRAHISEPEPSAQWPALRWASLSRRSADDDAVCGTPTCCATTADRLRHCYTCGRLFCARCCQKTGPEQVVACVGCKRQ